MVILLTKILKTLYIFVISTNNWKNWWNKRIKLKTKKNYGIDSKRLRIKLLPQEKIELEWFTDTHCNIFGVEEYRFA